MKLLRLTLGSLGALVAASFALATTDLNQQPAFRYPDGTLQRPTAPGSNSSASAPSTSAPEPSASPYLHGVPRFMSRPGPRGAPGRAADSSAATGTIDNNRRGRMPSWLGSFQYLGATFPFVMIGTNPEKGSATTTVRVMLIPLEFSFANGTRLSPLHTACGDTRSAMSRILKSPVFNSYPYVVGGTPVGDTQYIDAFQRANFWSSVQSKSPGYHVLLAPQVAASQSVNANGPFDLTVRGPCAAIGVVDVNDLDPLVMSLIETLQIPADVLPVFLTYNVFGQVGGSGCCILGYHSMTADRHPYLVASYSDPKIFVLPIEDIHALTHELGEWLDDPFVRNFIPAWGGVGQERGCSFGLETGDPVTGSAFEVSMHGFTYHPEDLVFLSWYARKTPSEAVNGAYTFLNAFAKPQFVRQP